MVTYLPGYLTGDTVRVYVLESVNIVRKYSGFMDAIFIKPSTLVATADWQTRKLIQVHSTIFILATLMSYRFPFYRMQWRRMLVNMSGSGVYTSFFPDIFSSTHFYR